MNFLQSYKSDQCVHVNVVCLFICKYIYFQLFGNFCDIKAGPDPAKLLFLRPSPRSSSFNSSVHQDCSSMVTTRSATRVVGNDSTKVMVLKPGSFVPQASTSDEDSEDPDIAPRHVKKRSKKRAGHRAKKKLKRRGRLDLMPTMNLDILFHVRLKPTNFLRKAHCELIQILSFLSPMDLLNLSRTSKDFRNLLLQRSSASVWKTARLQVDDLPDCPQDMSEPQYANLAFYPHCHVRRALPKVPQSLLTAMYYRIVTELSDLFYGHFGHDTAPDASVTSWSSWFRLVNPFVYAVHSTLDQWSTASRFPWTVNFNSYDLPHAIIYGTGGPTLICITVTLIFLRCCRPTQAAVPQEGT